MLPCIALPSPPSPFCLSCGPVVTWQVLFVLCTLLGGRRKIDVQRRLADYHLVDILSTMFDRLSWGHETPEVRDLFSFSEFHLVCNPVHTFLITTLFS